MSRTYLFVIIIKSVFTASIPLVNIGGLGLVINSLTSSKSPENVLNLIILYLSVNLAITLINQMLILWENYVMRKSSNVLQYAYMQDCLDIDYHNVQDGKILDLKLKSMMAQPAFSLSIWGACFDKVLQMIGAISIFSLLSPIFIGILLFLSVLLILITVYIHKCEFDFKNEKVEDDRKLAYLYDVMTKYQYAKEIRINNANTFIKNKYVVVLQIQILRLKQLIRKKIGVNLLSVFLSVVQAAIMYLYFTYQVSVSEIDIAQYTVLLASTTLFTTVLLSFFNNLGMINNCLEAIKFYREYEGIIINNSTISNSNRLEEVQIDFSNATLIFENVSFLYPGATHKVLKNINIEIPVGKKLGIVGLNGSGKTTLIKLLLRIYNPTEGRITLGGININEIPYYQYSKHIGVVLQDFTLFAYSLKENIVFEEEFNQDKLIESIEKSGLLCKVEGLKHGINTSIYRDLDDNGIEFSGGEGQKLALARAIYKTANMLILDEPTSALDPIAEYELFSCLNKISDNKTTIFISHRLSSTHFCDNIIVLDKGTIIEYGNHDSLLKENGFYASLYHLQARYYEENEVKMQ